MGAEADLTHYLIARYFRLGSFCTLYGFSWTVYAIAGAIGPVLMGRAFDLTGSYASLLTLLAASTVLCAALFLGLPRYPLSRER
jgi:cyanate permease